MSPRLKKLIEKSIFRFVRLSGINLLFLSLAGVLLGGWYTYSGFFVVFVLYYLAEVILERTGIGAVNTPENEFDFLDSENPGWIDRYGIYYYAISQILCIPAIFCVLSVHPMSAFEITGAILSTIFASGSIGGIAAHDLIHSKNRLIKWLGLVNLTTFNHGTFAVAHLLGHHNLVGRKEDCSTARYGESAYHFLYRAVFHGFFLAWRLENKRKRGFWRNEMVQISAAQILFTSTLLYFGGVKIFALHLIFSIGSISFIEIINYVTHYGVERKQLADRKWERIQDHHTWETNNKITNWFIFNTGKHVHHHRRPSDENYRLKLSNQAGIIPLGLQYLSILAFIPPLYFRYMDRLIEERETAAHRGVVDGNFGKSRDLVWPRAEVIIWLEDIGETALGSKNVQEPSPESRSC